MQKIPVFKTFGNMLDSVVENLGAAFTQSWPWLVVMFFARAAGDLMHLWYGKIAWATVNVNHRDYDMIDLGVGLITAVIFASIAVNWHRYILRNEVAEGAERLRLDGLVWRYFLFGIVIVIVIGAVMGLGTFVFVLLLIGLGAISKLLAVLIGIFVGFPAVIWMIGASVRLSVKLVGVALGNIEYTLSDAWDATMGNTWRLSGLYWLFVFAAILVALV